MEGAIMIFDKSVYRLKELSKRLEKGLDLSERAKLQARIDRLKQKGPDLYVKFYDESGTSVVEKVPLEYRGIRGAERFECLRKGQIELGQFTPKSAREAKIEEMCDHYLEGKMIGKAGYPAAASLCRYIKTHLGMYRLNDLSQNPKILAKHFFDFPEKKWAPKYRWNYRACLRAAIQFWIDSHEMCLYNPVDRVKIIKGIKKNEYVPTDQDFDRVLMATYTTGLQDEIRNILISVYETGLRINEVLKWLIEEMDLSEPQFDDAGTPTFLPYFTTVISKQNGELVKKRIPMSHRLWEVLKTQVGNRKEGRVFSYRTPPYKLLREVKLMEEASVSYKRPFHEYRKSVKYRNKILRKLPKELTKGFQGHTTDSMDEYYLHLQVQDLYPVVQDTWKAQIQGE
jgi:integrase